MRPCSQSFCNVLRCAAHLCFSENIWCIIALPHLWKIVQHFLSPCAIENDSPERLSTQTVLLSLWPLHLSCKKFFRQCLHWIWSSPRDLAHLRKSASVELGCNQRTFLLSRANTNLLKRESDTRIEKATTTFGRLRLRVWSTGNLCPR